MAKRPRTSRVDASLSLKLCMIRGCDLTIAGTLLGILNYHDCKGVVWVGEVSAPTDNVLSVVALNIQPQVTVRLVISGRKRHEAARHITTVQAERWVTIFTE